MSISKETLKRMIRESGGPELSDEGLEQVLAEVQVHQAHSETLQQLDLSKVLPVRLTRLEVSRRET